MRILDVFFPAILKEMLWRQNSPKCQHRPVHEKTISLTLIFMTHPALHRCPSIQLLSTFTFNHLADVFIQSDLQMRRAIEASKQTIGQQNAKFSKMRMSLP